jgi:putative bacteriocin precursor
MKKLGKKSRQDSLTVEAYASCYCSCGACNPNCSCPPGDGRINVSVYNSKYSSASGSLRNITSNFNSYYS